jgi:hypothetical protein
MPSTKKFGTVEQAAAWRRMHKLPNLGAAGTRRWMSSTKSAVPSRVAGTAKAGKSTPRRKPVAQSKRGRQATVRKHKATNAGVRKTSYKGRTRGGRGFARRT